MNTQQPIDFSNHKQRLDYINERVTSIAHWDEAAVIYLEPQTDDAHLWYATENFIAEVPRMVRPGMGEYAGAMVEEVGAIIHKHQGRAVAVVLDWGMGFGVYAAGKPPAR